MSPGSTSGLAPMSQKTVKPVLLGTVVVMQGRMGRFSPPSSYLNGVT